MPLFGYKPKGPKQEPAKVGWQVPETTVTASLPSELPSAKERIKYTIETGTTANEWKKKQHPLMRQENVTPVMGSPKIVGVGGTLSTAQKGFELAKKVSAGAPPALMKAIDFAAEVTETSSWLNKWWNKRSK